MGRTGASLRAYRCGVGRWGCCKQLVSSRSAVRRLSHGTQSRRLAASSCAVLRLQSPDREPVNLSAQLRLYGTRGINKLAC